MNRFKCLVYALALVSLAIGATPIGPYPSIRLSELPDPLRSVWKELKPEMDEMSHCAAAFDSHSDGEKGIKMPCKLVEE